LAVILISGTPGTGKTTLASELAKRLGYTFIDIGEYAAANHIYLGVDAKRNTKIINEQKLSKKLEKEARAADGKVIMSSHYAEILNPRLVEIVIVLRTHPDELKRRLIQRAWSPEKIQENLEAEILGVCSSNALTRYGRKRVYEIDTTGISPNETLKVAQEILQSRNETYSIGSISWLAQLEEENKLGSYFLQTRNEP
jgi:adenylate kinase